MKTLSLQNTQPAHAKLHRALVVVACMLPLLALSSLANGAEIRQDRERSQMEREVDIRMPGLGGAEREHIIVKASFDMLACHGIQHGYTADGETTSADIFTVLPQFADYDYALTSTATEQEELHNAVLDYDPYEMWRWGEEVARDYEAVGAIQNFAWSINQTQDVIYAGYWDGTSDWETIYHEVIAPLAYQYSAFNAICLETHLAE